MQKIRINNDIAISWGILTDGEKKSLEGRDIEVEISNTKGYSIKPVVTIQSNTLVFGFKGAEQTSLGVYQVKATDTTNGAMHTLDIAHAFELVPHSCAEDCECRCVKGIDIKYVELTSSVPSMLEYKTINGESIIGTGNIDTSERLILKKHTDLLYGAKFSALDYEFAKAYFKTHYAPVVGGCSVVRKGNKIARNLDWYYNNEVEFIVETDAGLNRHASKGFIGTISALTKDVVAQGVKGDIAKILPFRMTDGINDAGLYASINVVNADSAMAIADEGTTPNIEQRDEVCLSMLVRYILDNFSNAMDACNYIRDYVRVYAPMSAQEGKTDAQILVIDKSGGLYVLAFRGNNTLLLNEEFKGVLTNFRLINTKLTGAGRYAIDGSNIEDYGQGIERANIALDMLPTANIEDIIFALHYTSAYEQDSEWLTEFTGIEGATIHDTDKLRDIQRRARDKYLVTTRDKSDIWHTTHSVIYDLNSLSATYKTQEINDGNSTSGEFYINRDFYLIDASNYDFDEKNERARMAIEKFRYDETNPNINTDIVYIRGWANSLTLFHVDDIGPDFKAHYETDEPNKYAIITSDGDTSYIGYEEKTLADEARMNEQLEGINNKLNRKTEKVRVDIVGTTDAYQFKQGDKVLNFAELNELLQVSPNFVVFVHGSREHRCVEIINEGNARSMTFLAPTIEGTNVKAQSFKVTSSDGITITSIKRTDIVCENKTDADAARNRITALEDRYFYADITLDEETHKLEFVRQELIDAVYAINAGKIIVIKCRQSPSYISHIVTSACIFYNEPNYPCISFLHRDYIYLCELDPTSGTSGVKYWQVIGDAPMDGKKYVRQNGAWVEL